MRGNVFQLAHLKWRDLSFDTGRLNVSNKRGIAYGISIVSVLMFRMLSAQLVNSKRSQSPVFSSINTMSDLLLVTMSSGRMVLRPRSL